MSKRPGFGYFAAGYLFLLIALEALFVGCALSGFADQVARQGSIVALRYALPILFAMVLWKKYVRHHRTVGQLITATDALIIFLATGLQIASLHWMQSWPRVFLLLTTDMAVVGVCHSVAGLRWSRERSWSSIAHFETRSARSAVLGALALAAMFLVSRSSAGDRVSVVLAAVTALVAAAYLRRADAARKAPPAGAALGLAGAR